MESEPGGEMRDIKFPKPAKREPFLESVDKEVSLPPKAKRGRHMKALLIFLILATAAIGLSRFDMGREEVIGESNRSFSTFDDITSKLKDGLSAYSNFKDISLTALGLASFAEDMQSKLPDILTGKISLIDPLKEIKDKLKDLISSLDKVAGSEGYFKSKVPFLSEYLGWRGGLVSGQELLEGMLEILQSDEARHFIVIFGNTSELRPGGGFIGSFADIEIYEGKISKITVHDINEVDRAREDQVIPPKPLQAIVGKWRTADTNWFFDYPTSASKFLEFMHQSKMYAGVKIDGVATITPQVIKDILELTGPIELTNGIKLDASNFMNVIQKEVQDGQAEGERDPKMVLAELTPVLNEKIIQLSQSDQAELFSLSRSWIKEKDLMIYSPHEKLSKALRGLGVDGGLYDIANNSLGDYLAVVSANIGGGKTDLYVSQNIHLDSHINNDGLVQNTLIVTRDHNGDEREEWWYRETNWSYIKIFTPPGALPVEIEGFGLRGIQPKVDYKKNYLVDEDVRSIETSLVSSEDGKLQVFSESKKNVFGTWQKISPGGSKDLKISYSRNSKLPEDGKEYIFVFEAQAGANTSFEAIFTAPGGYVWAENDLPVYEIKSDDPPGKMVVSLTFKKN